MATKKCPFCGETILESAKMCSFCGNWVETKQPKAKAPKPKAPQHKLKSQTTQPMPQTPGYHTQPMSQATQPMHQAPQYQPQQFPPQAPQYQPQAPYQVPPAPGVATVPAQGQPWMARPSGPQYSVSTVKMQGGTTEGFFQRYFVRAFLMRYADFGGTTPRMEFWLTYLSLFIISLGVAGLNMLICGLVMGGNSFNALTLIVLPTLFNLAILLPSLAISCRRLRDSGKSPLLILLALIPFVGGLILLILLCMPSQYRNENQAPAKFGMPDIVITVACALLIIAGPIVYVRTIFNDLNVYNNADQMKVHVYTDESDSVEEAAEYTPADTTYYAPAVDSDNVMGISLYDLSNTILTAGDLRGLSKQDLRVLRNAVYARHGYIFRSPELQEYFAQYDWYDPRYTDVSDMLSDIEIRNVELIRSLE